MFAFWEINQMERKMCSHLEWQLNVDPSMLRDFQARSMCSHLEWQLNVDPSTLRDFQARIQQDFA